MRATWSEPYLWVHLAGLAAVPLFLELCLLGLAASAAQLPAQLVLLLVAAAGILPIAWMQLQRPFSIFSLLLLAVKPKELNEAQRQILQRFTAPIGKVVTVLTAGMAAVLLWQLSDWMLLVNPAKVALVPGGALGGLLLAMGAFLLANLFLQVPASVLTVMLTPEVLVRNATPYPVDQITQDFTLLGIPVNQILPRMTIDSTTPAPVDRPAAPAPTQARSNSWDEALTFEVDETTGSIEAVSVTDAELTAEQSAEDADEITVDWVDVSEAEFEADAEENSRIASVEAASEPDSVELDSIEPEARPAELIATDAAEPKRSEPELIEATSDLVAADSTGANFTQPDAEGKEEAGSIPITLAEHATQTNALLESSLVLEPEQSTQNEQTLLEVEAIAADVTDAIPEAEIVAVPQDETVKIEILAPNAADMVVSIVLNHEISAPDIPDQSASFAPAPARTASEIVVMIIPS